MDSETETRLGVALLAHLASVIYASPFRDELPAPEPYPIGRVIRLKAEDSGEWQAYVRMADGLGKPIWWNLSALSWADPGP